jgi:hypothetical protein
MMKHDEMKRRAEVSEAVRRVWGQPAEEGARAIGLALPVSVAAPPERIGPDEPARVMWLSEMMFCAAARREGRLQ